MTNAQLQTVLEKIRIIDARSDGICREVYRRTRLNIFNAGSWQLAWDRYPDLYDRRQALGKVRIGLMDERDTLLEKEHRAAQRRERAKYRKPIVAKQCPTCGAHTFELAA